MSNNTKDKVSQKKDGSFSWLRELLFPIHLHELKRFIPMALMMLFILFNYTILRNVKDSLVINARGSDAEIVSFLKLWGTMPAAILFMVFYAKITEFLKKENIFYLCTTAFITFFGAFAFIIYPNIDLLHPDPTWVASLKNQYPNFKWFIVMWGNWSFALFYILSELWGSVMLSLFFWQHANETVDSHQTKRFYPLFGVVGNVGLIFSGSIVEYFSNLGATLNTGQDPWQITLYYLMSAIVISGVSILALFYMTCRNKEDKENKDQKNLKDSKSSITAKKPKVKKEKLSIVDSFRVLFSSKHLFYISFIVFSYGIAINYMDVLWKGQTKAFFAGDYNMFAAYMGSFSRTTGLIAIPVMLVGGNILRRLSWLKAASVTPLILFLTALPFFAVVILGTFYAEGAEVFTYLGLAVQIGFWQNSLTKATKYSLFDPTKEMAYKPLDDTLRTKGKAAVDVAGSRLGKSGGAFTFFILQTVLPSFTLVQFAPFLAVVTLIILVYWFYSISGLNKSMLALEKEKELKLEQAKEAEVEALKVG